MSGKILLHICCAPDATVPVEEFQREGREVVGYFHGANIHPSEEYQARKNAVEKLALHFGIECCFGNPNPEIWLEKTSLLSDEPEGGKRCAVCFRLQLEEAARAALSTGCTVLCTTLTISPHKNVALINEIGQEVADACGLEWQARVWRKENGFLRSIKMAEELSLFRQSYCGCIYSKTKFKL